MTAKKRIERIKTDEKINDISDNVKILQNFIDLYLTKFEIIMSNMIYNILEKSTKNFLVLLFQSSLGFFLVKQKY
jgi:hypothetical protein